MTTNSLPLSWHELLTGGALAVALATVLFARWVSSWGKTLPKDFETVSRLNEKMRFIQFAAASSCLSALMSPQTETALHAALLTVTGLSMVAVSRRSKGLWWQSRFRGLTTAALIGSYLAAAYLITLRPLFFTLIACYSLQSYCRTMQALGAERHEHFRMLRAKLTDDFRRIALPQPVLTPYELHRNARDIFKKAS